MSCSICVRVFITTGSTVTSSAAKALASFSIASIWTRQDWQPAPSEKYSSTFSPRCWARVCVTPLVSVSEKSGAFRTASDDSGREVSIMAVTVATTVTATSAQIAVRTCR